MVRIMPDGNYARMVELKNGNYIAVARNAQGITYTHSTDKGRTWSVQKPAALREEHRSLHNAEIMECSDGTLLLSYSHRPPEDNTTPGLNHTIRVKKSTDGGHTWGDEIFVFDAGHTRRTGCWEPATLELPSGEIHLYFANESVYPTGNDQNISLCRSFDKGETWSDPEIISYRQRHRDGMPVPLYLPETKEIIVVIEDNGWPNHPRRFQPSIIRTTIDDNWRSGTIGAQSLKREFALAEPMDPLDNAGAPYICRAKTGEIILSYQTTENRDLPLLNGVKDKDKSQEMGVAVGDEQGRNFTKRTLPFEIPLGPGGKLPESGNGYQGKWNSLYVDSSGRIWAITSTNAYGPKTEIWGITGYLVED